MFAKIFSSIWDGSLRGKSDSILVFVNLLTHCDVDGNVDRHFKAIADETGLPVARVRRAIGELEAPDAQSRTPELGGRRLERIDEHKDWGWHVVNHNYYRNLNAESIRREKTRLRVQRHREKENPSPTPPSQSTEADSRSRGNVTVTPVTLCNAPSMEDVKKYILGTRANGSDYTDGETKSAFFALQQKGWRVGNNPVVDWRAAIERQIQLDRGHTNGKFQAAKQRRSANL